MNSSASTLPRWELNSRFGFESPFDEKLDEYVEETRAMAVLFKEKFESELESKLVPAIEEYEQISIRRSTVSNYLHLSQDTDLNNNKLKKRKAHISQILAQDYGNFLSWFSLDLASLENLPEDLGPYKTWVEEVRRSRPHNLEKNVERALTVRSPYTGSRPLVSFVDKELSLLKFKLGEEDVNLEILLSRMGSSGDAEVRAKCLQALNEGLSTHMVRISALSLSAVTGSWLIENKERNYSNLRSRRNLDNNVPDEVVDSLLQGVRQAGVPLAKRYYALKKQILFSTNNDMETFTWSDRNAPISVKKDDGEEKKVSWDEAVHIVERGYKKFSPTMAEMFVNMVNEKRIDVPAADGKKGGAYCAGVVPGIGPFQLLNFDGTKRDVATLAHESGHGCHDILAYKQGYLQYHPPLTLAETASIFGEMIVFRDLLDLAAEQKDKAEQLSLLMGKIDDVVNSVVRQCSFDYFEQLAHSAREKGELSADELDEFWLTTMKEYYGTPGVDSPFDSYDNVSHLWAYVPHFHHVPFYVYSYAFADLVVGTLYHSFQTTPEGFEQRLLDLLSAGSTKDFVEALEPFGLQPQNPSFWGDALEAHLGGLVNEAEEIAIELGLAPTVCSFK